jgi:hypothetical protein
MRHLWVRRASALLVAVVAAYASYEHQRRFASVWGSEQVSALLWPLSVDGLVVLASLGLLEVGPSARLRVRWSVRAAFLLGVAVSLLANIAAAPMLTWQSVVVAGWPPVALLLAVELLTVGDSCPVADDRSSHEAQPDGLDGDDAHGRNVQVPSVRAAVRRLLETSGTALTNSQIVAALRAMQGETSDKRFRANVSNALWSLRKSGVVVTEDGKSVLASRSRPRLVGRGGHCGVAVAGSATANNANPSIPNRSLSGVSP